MSWFSDLLIRYGWTSIQDNAIPTTGTIAKQELETFPVALANQIAGGSHGYPTVGELQTVPLEELIAPMQAYVGTGLSTVRYILTSLPTTGDYIGNVLQNFENFWTLDFSASGISVDREVATFALLPADAIDGENVYVSDASGDPTVNSGWAIYKSLGDKPAGTWLKIAEAESIDIDISTKVNKSGDTMTGDLNMSGTQKVTNAVAGTGASDYTRKDQQILRDGTQTFTGDQSMGSNKITSLSPGTLGTDAINLNQLNAAIPTIVTNTTIIDLGDWDMDTDTTLAVAHGLGDHTKIRIVEVIIRDDLPTPNLYKLDTSDGTGSTEGAIATIDSTNVNIRRKVGGLFDSTNFDATSYNRGWLTIETIP